MKLGKPLLAVLAALSLAGSATPALAESRSTILAGLKAPDATIYGAYYYRAIKSVTLHIPTMEWRGHLHPAFPTFKVTLPKGTTVAITKAAFAPRGDLAIMANELSSQYITRIHQKGYVLNGPATATASAFHRVSAPSYMPTESSGKLYHGENHSDMKTQRGGGVTNDVTITTDGYVQVYNRHTKWPEIRLNDPVASAKITKTRVKGATRYLYLNHPLNALKTVRVAHAGNAQYRLTVTNLHDPQNLPGDEDQDTPTAVFSLYRLDGAVFFTPIGEYE